MDICTGTPYDCGDGLGQHQLRAGHSVPYAESQGRWLGADAAIQAAAWLHLSERDARSILGDVDSEVVDRQDAIARDIGLTGDPSEFSPGGDPNVMERFRRGWIDGRDLVWGDTLQAAALRTLGRTVEADAIDQAVARTLQCLEQRAEQGRLADS